MGIQAGKAECLHGKAAREHITQYPNYQCKAPKQKICKLKIVTTKGEVINFRFGFNIHIDRPHFRFLIIGIFFFKKKEKYKK